ncbi:hypothetical protein [Brassicibacter mesophilus]|jgi:hypothetical protein|uniref:hypothetical protein n=1 Tax=Brassicibacter mesophilus TaxID=745119 RepID=UPI003D1E2BCC
MKKGDIIWGLVLALFVLIIVMPVTHDIFVKLTTEHPYIGGFIKFFILATMGELLAIRIAKGNWNIPCGVVYRAAIWGFLGMVITLIFSVFANGTMTALENRMLPGKGSKLAFAFFTSAIMNSTFAPTMMAFHRVTDTYIDLKYESKNQKVSISDITSRIDWNGFVSFVVMKTIPFFWIPAHTVTFLLPPEYRVLAAALLSVALGGILAFAKKK